MKILFIGNSHTFFNDMPEMVRLFGKARGVDIDVVQNTSGGRGMDWQSNQFDVRFNVLFGGYDYIVVQHIAHPFPGRDHLLDAAAKLMPYLAKSGAKIINFLPWSEKKLPEGQAVINEAHDALHARYPDLIKAPVGYIWDELRHSHPEIELYWHDSEHASPLGSWLIAATFFRVVTGERAEALPCTLDMGNPTFQGVTMKIEGRDIFITQDFDAPAAYDLDPVACAVIARAVDKHTPGK